MPKKPPSQPKCSGSTDADPQVELTPEPAASVTAETAIAVFRTSFERWVAEDAERELADVVRESLDTLRAVTAAG